MSESIVIVKPDPSDLVAEFSPLAERARTLLVRDKDEHGEALRAIKRLTDVERKLTEHFEPTRKSLDTAKKDLLAARDALIAPFSKARVIIGTKVIAYEEEEERQRREAERLAREEARRIEEERALLDAVNAEAEGDTALAEAILEQPVALPTVRVEPQIAKVDGVSKRESWSAEVTDLLLLIRYVAQNPQYANLLQANTTALNGLARSLKAELRIPGVKATSTVVRTVRTQ